MKIGDFYWDTHYDVFYNAIILLEVVGKEPWGINYTCDVIHSTNPEVLNIGEQISRGPYDLDLVQIKIMTLDNKMIWITK